MELWLVRHGETIVASDGLYKPHHGLTELGLEQARSVAKALADIDFDICYSSALPRAVQTAEIFANLTSRSFTRIPELNEIDVGHIEDAPVEFKSKIINHRVDLDFSQFGGENPVEFSKRICRGFRQLLSDAESRECNRIVGFLHGGTIGAILDYIEGREFDYRSRPRMPNCSYTTVKRLSNGYWSEFNGWQSDHLPAIT